MTPPDDLLKRAKAHLANVARDPSDQHGMRDRTPSVVWISGLVTAIESDRALLRRIGEALDKFDATAPTVLNAPTSLFVRTVRALIDEARARVTP